MYNYLRAELYKVLHRRYTYIFLIVVLALETLLVSGWVFTNSNGNHVDFYSGAVMVVMMFSVGLYATLITGDLVFSDQYKFNTLKNEVSYGLSRTRIYLGKLIMSCVVALVMCAIILVFYLGLCFLLLPHDAASGNPLPVIGYCLAVALPLWLGCQALVTMLFFLFKSSNVASFVLVGVIAGAGQIFQLLGALVHQGFLLLYRVMLTTPLDAAPNMVGDWGFCGQAWLIGLGWFVLSTAVGLWCFQRKEIS